MEEAPRHEPVMVEEVLELLAVRPGGAYLDLTLGGGGHARTILLSDPTARLLGVDRDRETLQGAAARLAEFGSRVRVIAQRFDLADEAPGGPGIGEFDGIVLDLGMSSLQVDDPERGFSFQVDAPLDLRMDRSAGETAAQLVNRLSERQLADVLFQYGEERRSRAIARAIVARRKSAPLRRTGELVDLVEGVLGRRRGGRIHPATRTFQALRIAVNDELGCLERVLPKAVSWLATGGRLVIIAFHSLEDRIVKRFLREEHAGQRLEVLTRKPRRPTDEEVRRNRRARSARVRAASRLAVAT